MRFHKGQSSGTKRKADEIERRRNRIRKRLRALKALVPNCNKRSKASILGAAIEYIKFLQLQVQMMQSMEVGTMSQGLYMSLGRQPSVPVPNVAPPFTMRPLIDMQQGMPQMGLCVPTNFPLYFPEFPSWMPPMEMGTGSYSWPRPLLYPHQLPFASETSQPVYSTAPSSDTFIPTTCSQVDSTILVQPSYHTSSRNPVGYAVGSSAFSFAQAY